MRNSIKCGAIVVASIAMLSAPVFADAPRGNHVKQTAPDYWEPALRDNSNATVTNAPRPAQPQQNATRPSQANQSRAKSAVEIYRDLEIMP